MELERDSAAGDARAMPAGDASADLAGGWALVQRDWGLRTLDGDAPARAWLAVLAASARWLARALWRCGAAPGATEAPR